MKSILRAIVFIFLLACGFWILGKNPDTKTSADRHSANGKTALMTGDILFQSSEGGQGKAIQLATKSKYSHCGVLVIKGAKLYVLEANGPVGLTPYTDFINRGNGKWVTKRLKNRSKYFNDSTEKVFYAEGKKYIGTKYDPYFGWNDSLIYCSELVWKIYNRALGIEVGELQKLKDFDLSHPIVKAKLAERFGKSIPLEEKVISPSKIFESGLLETIESK